MGGIAYYGCKKLQSVEFQEPSECIEIPDWEFYKCEVLDYIHLPERLKYMGRQAFYQCAFENIDLTQELERIGESAFLKCKQLRTVRIPSSIEEIGKWVLYGCNRLEVLEIHHTPRILGDWITNKACIICCLEGSGMEKYAREYGMNVAYI